MFMMTRPVGEMSSNKIEDVALVQAALKQIRGRNGRPLWPGPIDGKTGTRDIDSLSAAIAGFESKANLRLTGTLANSGNAFNALGRGLPTNYKDMHGVPGTNIVAGHVARKRPKPDGGVSELALPEALAADLLALVRRLEKALNYLPTVRADGADANGHDKVTVDLGLRFLDPQGRIPGKTAPVPQVIQRLVDTAVGGSQRFKLSQMQGAQLTLVSTDTQSFPAARLAGGSNAWPVFTGSVGKGGGNAIHDVAALQAALANITTPGASDPFWEGKVDGRASNDLNAALSAFQAAAGLDATGTVKPGDASVKALSALLPSELKGLRGVRGMPLAYIDRQVGPAAVPLAQVPEDLRVPLTRLAATVEQRFGLALTLRAMPREVFNDIKIEMSLGHGAFLDASGNALPALETPTPTRDALVDILAEYPPLALDRDAPPGRLVLRLPRAAVGDIEHVNNDVFALYDTASFLVGRPLGFPAGEYIGGHLFIVAGARYIGDPEASVYSYARTGTVLRRLESTLYMLKGTRIEIPQKLLGRVDDEFKDDWSETTHRDDVAFWESLAEAGNANKKWPLPAEVSPIYAEATEVRWLAENLVMDQAYALLVVSDLVANSNSAAQAIANQANTRGEVPLPESPGIVGYLGAGNWDLINFGDQYP